MLLTNRTTDRKRFGRVEHPNCKRGKTRPSRLCSDQSQAGNVFNGKARSSEAQIPMGLVLSQLRETERLQFCRTERSLGSSARSRRE